MQHRRTKWVWIDGFSSGVWKSEWCCLQVKLCDPCLSALRMRYLSSRALYKSTYLYHNYSPALVWATSRLMSPDRGFGTSCVAHCGRLTVSANSEDSWKRFCLSRTRLRRLVTLAFRHQIQYSYLLTYLLTYLQRHRWSNATPRQHETTTTKQ